jgi:hypothetical protein
VLALLANGRHRNPFAEMGCGPAPRVGERCFLRTPDGAPTEWTARSGQLETRPRRRKSILTRKWHAHFPEGQCGFEPSPNGERYSSAHQASRLWPRVGSPAHPGRADGLHRHQRRELLSIAFAPAREQPSHQEEQTAMALSDDLAARRECRALATLALAVSRISTRLFRCKTIICLAPIAVTFAVWTGIWLARDARQIRSRQRRQC